MKQIHVFPWCYLLLLLYLFYDLGASFCILKPAYMIAIFVYCVVIVQVIECSYFVELALYMMEGLVSGFSWNSCKAKLMCERYSFVIFKSKFIVVYVVKDCYQIILFSSARILFST